MKLDRRVRVSVGAVVALMVVVISMAGPASASDKTKVNLSASRHQASTPPDPSDHFMLKTVYAPFAADLFEDEYEIAEEVEVEPEGIVGPVPTEQAFESGGMQLGLEFDMAFEGDGFELFGARASALAGMAILLAELID